MSIFKFLTKKSTLLCLGLLVLFAFVAPVDVWAANGTYGGGDPDKTGPFTAFLWRAARLFMQTRNALFVLAAFAFIAYAWTAIQKGSVEWEKIFYLIVGLTILGVAGWVVSYMADPGKSDAVVTTYQNLGNTDGWD
ncbi:MAG: hypothetical protein IJ638_01330 [Alphaproteobacteria bacterium]|nr:hypothetical protein [Alphaproteobacteria bacterium]